MLTSTLTTSASSAEPARTVDVPQFAIRKQTAGAFLLFHLMLPLAAVPWFFSWTGVISVAVGYYVFDGLGICLCYHRLLTHGSAKVPKWLERTLATFGMCSLQDSPAHWVAIHRKHHQHSDDDHDPHSPLKSFFWGHMGWLFFKQVKPRRVRNAIIRKYTPDLMADPYYQRLEQGNLWVWIFVIHAVLFFAAAFGIEYLLTHDLYSAFQFGMSMLLWGVVVRVVVTWHLTWAVNSVAHTSGYRNYDTKDNSRNNWLLAWFTWGEGWHNNHHADQRSAAHGHRWWEFDPTYITIRLLRRVGLAWDVVEPRSGDHD
jgi:fatty-acid desaturase